MRLATATEKPFNRLMKMNSKIMYHIITIYILILGISESTNAMAIRPRLPKTGQTVLLISLDGFRWDYMSKTKTPNLDFIVNSGVKASYLRSSFPTTTYPNHFTVVTGLYPESHGIVANYMYDPLLDTHFNTLNTDPQWWGAFGAKPLWITNEEHGGKSAVIHWPGYNVRFDRKLPALNVLSPSANIDIGNQTGRVISFEKRVELVTKWLTSNDPPNFVALYFEEPDEKAHSFGPNSLQTRHVIVELDRIIGILLKNLRAKEILDRINLIVTSDHGMTEISSKRQIYIDEYIDSRSYDLWDASTNLMISPHKGKSDEIYKHAKRMPHVKVYRKEYIPSFFHFSHNRRVPDLFILVDEGWSITRGERERELEWVAGTHGYSNKYRSMSGFFIARGPAFKVKYKARGFDNVHLYPLLCRILGLPARPNNGTLMATEGMLKPSFVRATSRKSTRGATKIKSWSDAT